METVAPCIECARQTHHEHEEFSNTGVDQNVDGRSD